MPWTVRVLPEVVAEATAGLFWRLLGPKSAWPGSLGLRPSSSRSMPRPALEKMEFWRMRLPVLTSKKTVTPSEKHTCP